MSLHGSRKIYNAFLSFQPDFRSADALVLLIHLKCGHELKLMEIESVHTVNPGLCCFIFAFACQNIVIQNRVGETNLVFIRKSAEAIGRCLADQVLGKSKYFANLDDFMYQKVGEGAEVAGCITEFC